MHPAWKKRSLYCERYRQRTKTCNVQRPTEVKRPAATIELRPSVLRPTKSARGFPPTEQDVLVLQPSF
ncbi:unnamed protein product [Lasius platythorax]|uniref:Uncharacterized protein n=1 Tax=Lasius platythorax TaxID=488582 RepID=A0AAV2P6W2_9HYME